MVQVHLPRDAAVMLTCFNLGYLPSGNKSLTTQADSTLAGLKAAAKVTAPGGLISIISYTHHPGMYLSVGHTFMLGESGLHC